MLLEVVVAVFVATQLGYFFLHCALVGLFVRRPVDVIDERTLGRVLERAETETESATRSQRALADGSRGPASGHDPAARSAGVADRGPGPACRLPERSRRRIRVLVPVFGSRWEWLEGTLASLAAQSYPVDRLSVYVLYEGADPGAAKLADTLESGRTTGLELLPVEVDGVPTALTADQSSGEPSAPGDDDPQIRAAVLARGFETLSVADDDLVTVVDAGTQLPVDTLELAVAGLEEYDIVQAKQTAGTADHGLLPQLESMGSAVRSELWAASSSRGPFNLLAEGYVVPARVLDELDHRCRDGVACVPGECDIGVAAARQGCRLGILDRYVRRRCPSTTDAWIRRNRRRVREPYRNLPAPDWSLFDRLQFVAPAVVTHLVAVANVVGIPIALLVLLSIAFGAVSLSLPLAVLVGCNTIGWLYYGVRAQRAARDAVPLESRLSRIRYSLVSNPVTNALYLALWAVPIALAVRDVVRGESSASG